jgi:hypothetical protein
VFLFRSKTILTSLVFNKSVKLELSAENIINMEELSYVYLENKNINLEMIKTGFANPDFPRVKILITRIFFLRGIIVFTGKIYVKNQIRFVRIA